MTSSPTRKGTFVQLIEYRSDRGAEIQRLVEDWATAIGAERTARWYITTTDRDQPDTFVHLVEFPGHAEAMANSGHPATAKFAAALHELSSGDVIFRNLDVIAAGDL